MNKSKNTLVIVLFSVMIIVLIGFLVGCWFFSKEKEPLLSVVIGENEYTENTTKLMMNNGEVITVNGTNEYDVKIYPKATDVDFAFTVGSKVCQWSDALETDFTDGFGIVKGEKSFKITYINLVTVIANVLRYDYGEMKLPNVPAGDLFEMRIVSGKKMIKLGFTLSDLGGDVVVIGIEIDTDHIIFGGSNDKIK